jgi:hypothetical protein
MSNSHEDHLGSSILTAESLAEVDPHILIRQAMQGHWDDPDLDAALRACPDLECQECARIVCFSNDPLHFHHDGCPSCEMAHQAARDQR